MSRIHCLIALLIVGIFVPGCYLRPNFGPPGTIGMQRSRAVLHDPYPSNELGPPILGGRPRGFDNPQAQAENLQEVRNSLFNAPVSNVQAYPAAAPPAQQNFQVPVQQNFQAPVQQNFQAPFQ